MILLILPGLVALYIIHQFFQFIRNLRITKSTGLPYTCVPVSEFNLILIGLFDSPGLPYVVNKWLPGWLADLINDNVVNYRWTVQDRQAKKLGRVYMTASPTSLSCHVSDAAVVSQICSERKSFPKPVWQYEVLDLYGPNVLTCEDKQWAHHRRHTASTFNENSNKLVWQVAIQQALEMTQHWSDEYSEDSGKKFILNAAKTDILKFTLNVLCGAGFGVTLPFKPESRDTVSDKIETIFKDTDTPPEGFDFTFRAVVEYMNTELNTVIFANMLTPSWIPRVLLPFFKKDYLAYRDFGNYLRALIMMSKADSTSQTHNLLQGISRSQALADGKDKLTDSEILGNIHIFTVAGHETTATTLRYTLVLLALHPDTQDWLYESLEESNLSSNPQEWDYTTVFPKLIAPLCVMLETLRLYPPVVSVPKWTNDSSVPITHNGNTYLLPPRTNINLNANALHYAEEYWGPDAASFNPRRWDKANKSSFLAQNDGKPGLSGPGIEFDGIHKPVRGAYIPFSDGFRACPGKRFAQVEFVAALAVIAKGYRVRLARGEDQVEEDVTGRAERILNESSTVLTLAMREDVPLLFESRNVH